MDVVVVVVVVVIMTLVSDDISIRWLWSASDDSSIKWMVVERQFKKFCRYIMFEDVSNELYVYLSVFGVGVMRGIMLIVVDDRCWK